MAAPHTPQLTVEAGFGSASLSEAVTWTDITGLALSDLSISRGRPSELDRFKPASCSLGLVDTTARNLDPTNLSGAYVETQVTSEFPIITGDGPTNENGTSLGTNNSFTLPTGVTVGELLLAYVTVDLNGGAGGIATGTGSAVWTELFDDANGTAVRHALYARIATGSDALVLTGPTEDYVVQIIRVGRHGCATTADIEVGTTATGTSQFPIPTTLSPGPAKWMWIVMAGVDTTTTTDVVVTEISDFYEIDAQLSAVSTTSCALAWGYKQEESGTNSTSTISVSSSRAWVCAQIAIPPELTSVDRTQVVPGVPLRVVAALPAAEEVFNDVATGPELHSAWRVEQGAITGSISGDYPIPTGTVMTGPAYNFDEDASFYFGTAADGASPNHDVRIVLSNGGYIGWNLTATTLTYYVFDGGSTTDDTVAWNDTTMRYLRVTFDGDDVLFERSANSSSWTTIDTYTRGSDFASTVDWSYGYLYVSNTGTTTPSLDNFLVKVSRTTLFVGTVDTWGYHPLGGNQGALVDLTASDAFKDLANTQLPQRWQTAVQALAPAAWYPLGERDGTLAHDASGNNYDGEYPAGLVAQGEPPVTPPLGNGSVRMVHKYPPFFRGVRLPDAVRRESYPYSVNLWMRGDGSFPTTFTSSSEGVGHPGMLFAQGATGGNLWTYVSIITDYYYQDPDDTVTVISWKITVTRYTDTSNSWSTGFTAPIGDGLPHMVTVVQTNVTTTAVYIDGISQPKVPTLLGTELDGDLAEAFDDVQGIWIGPPTARLIYDDSDLLDVAWNTPFWGLEGWIDEVTLHDEALDADQVLALYQAGARIGEGDTTGARVNRVLDLIGWPEGLRRIDGGTTTMAADYLFGETVLSYLQKVETTEGGRLFIGPHGEVVFQDALRVDTRDTSPVLFDDAGAGVNILGDGFDVSFDDRYLITGAQVTRVGGLEQSYRDEVAAARYGVRDWSAELLNRTDIEAYMRAVGMVETYKTPAPRIGAWRAAPQKTPADWPAVLNVRLGDTARLQFQLLDTGDTFDDYLDVAQVTMRVAGGAWTIEYMGTPQSPGIGNFFEFDAPTSSDTGFDYGEWR